MRRSSSVTGGPERVLSISEAGAPALGASLLFAGSAFVFIGIASFDSTIGFRLAMVALGLWVGVPAVMRRGAAVELGSGGVVVRRWAMRRAARAIPLSDVLRFVALPPRGGVLGVELVDGSVVKTLIQRTLLTMILRRDPVAIALERLNMHLRTLRSHE